MQKSHEKIIQEHSHTVFRLAYAILQNKSDADDVYQEVFLRYVRKSPCFNDDGHERAWFIKVTINCARSLASSPFRKRTQPLNNADASYCMDEQSMTLRDMVRRLTPKYRIVIHLFYYEDMPVAQISTVLGIRETTIRSQLSRARDMLRQNMRGENNVF